MKDYIKAQFHELGECLAELEAQSAEVLAIAMACVEAIRKGNKIIFCGNGGSASQSQHLAAELVGRYLLDRPAMNSLSLTVDTSNITAIGNDYGYDVIFSRQLEGVGKAGDILFGLSTSGNSRNVVLAFEQAKKMGIRTVAFIGAREGVMKEMADYVIAVPAMTSAHIQEMHLAVGHLICDIIEKQIHA